ncbi:MAG: beta-lactamase family protein, partial [Dehalococcoidales bacterium]|nr:beta-lactamase family protein [Dehalococcoidales bacterium]
YPEIDDYIHQQMLVDNIPGLAVVVVQGDEIVYCKGFGISSVETNQPVTPQTIFDLASVSKSFTALGVLLLRDDGLIDLDSPIQKYLPDFQPNSPLASHITVRQLLNHTSGLPGAFSAPLIFQQGDDEMAELVTALGRIRLNREPGSSFEYADINYCLLGALIERVSGKTFEDYIYQNIFVPLGMPNTTLYPDEAAVLDRAEGHQSMYGQIVTRHIPIYRSALPAGWVMSCAEDMGQWLMAHLNGGLTAGGQVIPAADIEEAHSSTIMFEENGEEVGYGMGWFISSVDDALLIWHGGDTPNFTADMIMLSDYETGVVVLVNSQASTNGHSIAPGVANLILGLELEMMGVPWWAHWKAIDTLATIALVFIILLVLAWIFYILYIWRQFRAKKRHFIGSSLAGPMLQAWQLVFYVIPVVLISMFVLSGYLVVKTLYGYNLFEVLLLFRLGSPPGVYISGVSLLIILFLWALLLAFKGLFTRRSKELA